MILATKQFFDLIRIHHKLPLKHRPNDLAGRLRSMADPTTGERMRVDPLTRRCLNLFLAKRLQRSSTQDVA